VPLLLEVSGRRGANLVGASGPVETLSPDLDSGLVGMSAPGGGLRNRWLDLPVRAKGAVVVAVPLVALLAVVGMSLALQLQERQVRTSATKANALVAGAQNGLLAALNAETGVRAYAATGAVSFLQPYHQAQRALPATLAGLDDAARNDGQRAAGEQIQAGLRAQFALLGQLRVTVANGGGAALLTSQLAQGKVLMDRLRQQVAGITTSQSLLVQRQRTQIDNIEARAEVVDITGLIVGLLVGVAGISLFGAGIASRVGEAVANARRLGQGRRLVPSRASDDELGQLAEALQQAEQLLADRAADLVVARDEAQAASHAKTRFLSRTSHELRTPLNAVLGFAQLLEFSPLADDDRDSVAHILTAGRHLVGLINDVLDISRIESGEMTLSLEPVPVPTATTEVTDLMRPLAAQRSITIHQACQEAGLAAHADRQRLNQILLNLVSNAVKYNRDGGNVTISCASTEADRVDIRVTDTGPGFTAAQLERLFTPFERLGAEQTSIEGSGIGLALTKALTEAMGGTLEVTSLPGHGSTFTVQLPRAVDVDLHRQSILSPATAPRLIPSTGHSRVLYVEDNLASVQIMERLMANRADTVLYVAISGQLGIDLARQHHPTLILLDLHLPDLGGDVVLQRLRAEPGTANIPVVMLSADANASSVRRLLNLGATGYLTKPIDLHELLVLLDRTAETEDDTTSKPGEPMSNTVVYIEDSDLNANLVARLLQQLRPGITLHVAPDGRTGLQLARTYHPDLILLDRNLPDMSGDDVLASLKSTPDTATVPVVILSGDTGGNMTERLLAAGANDFLTKPYNRDDFLTIIDRWC
jgi:signal transduction histidine kinase/DNA-binding response OmpR family regulator